MADPRAPSFAEHAANFPGNPFGNLYGNVGPSAPRPPSVFGMTPGAGSGSMEGILQAVMPMLGEMFKDQFGGSAFLFGSDMNAASARYANDFLKQTRESRSAGARSDEEQVRQLFQGLAVAIGHQPTRNRETGRLGFSDDVNKSIDRLAGDASTMLPILAAMFPDTIDKILPRGSLAVAGASFVNAGRFVIDPATGRPTSENADFATQVLKPLLDAGPRATSGLAAGRLGQTYEALVNQGLIGSGNDLRQQVQARNAAASLFGESAVGEVGLTGKKAQEIQAGRIRDQLQSYSKAISAINDIFADEGNPNAPMPELIKALDSLTQGGMTAYDPASLAKVTRTFQAAARESGLGYGGLNALSTNTAMMLEQFGGHFRSGAPIALYAAAAGAEFAGFGFGTARPQGMSRSEFITGIAANKAGFEGSERGNLYGAISALARVGIPEGSDFAALAAGLRRGETTITLPSGEVVNTLTATSDTYNKIAVSSGLGGSLLTQLMARSDNVAEFVREPGLRRTGDAAQRAEAEDRLYNMLGANFMNAVPREKFIESLRKNVLDSDLIGDSNLARSIGEDLGINTELRGQLSGTLGVIAGQTGGRFKDSISMFRAQSPEFQRATNERMRQFEAAGGRWADLASLNRGGFTRAFATEVARWGIDKDIPSWMTSLARGVGLVTNEDTAAAVRGEDPFSAGWRAMQAFDPNNVIIGGAPLSVGRGEDNGGGGLNKLIGDARRGMRVDKWKEGIAEGTDPENQGWLGRMGSQAARQIKQRAANAGVGAGKGAQDINVKFAVLKIEQDGSATLNATGTAQAPAPRSK